MNMNPFVKTYIINLPKDTGRKEYMHNLLKPLSSFLDYEFIEAIYGKSLLQVELERVFNNRKAYKKYGRYLDPGEIGCTLSHRYACGKLLEENLNYALIFEDDIDLKLEFQATLFKVYSLLLTDIPRIVLLSGGYSYLRKKKYKDLDIALVHDAYYTHSYIINKEAAKCILKHEASYIADDWMYLRRLGIEVVGLIPHIVNQKRDNGIFTSNIWSELHVVNKSKLDMIHLCKYLKNSIVTKSLIRFGNWEPFK